MRIGAGAGLMSFSLRLRLRLRAPLVRRWPLHKRLTRESSAPTPCRNRARSRRSTCRPPVWRVRACPASHSDRLVLLHRASPGSLPVVAAAQPKQSSVVPDLHVNVRGLGVMERVADGLGANSIDLIAKERGQRSRLPFDVHSEGRRAPFVVFAPEFFS